MVARSGDGLRYLEDLRALRKYTNFASYSINLPLKYYQLLTTAEATACSPAIAMTIGTGSAHIAFYDDALTERTIPSPAGPAGLSIFDYLAATIRQSSFATRSQF